MASEKRLESLKVMANRLRRDSILSTTAAGSGHPTSCMSAADLVAALFFQFLKFDTSNPRNPHNDRFVLSKGHAAPLLWAAWAEAGAFPVEKLETLREIDSNLEGHPTPRHPLVDVATGSLGQGLSMGVGMALASRLNGVRNQVYVLIGDGEAAEGSIWEAAELASYYRLSNLVAIIDVNRLGQSQPTMNGHQLDVFERRFQAFGWHAQSIDGHDMPAIVKALETAVGVSDRPAVIVARTLKGKGVSFLEDVDGWHGKPLPKADVDKALAELGPVADLPEPLSLARPGGSGEVTRAAVLEGDEIPSSYSLGEEVATRQAYGSGLKKLGERSQAVVALDGDTKNSTYSEKFLQAFPDRFIECFIAEQNMVGVASGMSVLGKIPFASTFACFLTRALDQIRMASLSQANVKLCGSHAGISIGEDGPSQMGLEDLAMMRAIQGSTVLYPSDAVSCEFLVQQAARTPGIVYIRSSRPKTPVLYSNEEQFPVGGSKVLRSSSQDRATVVAAGITLHEALKAADQLSSQGMAVRVIDLYSIKPLDEETLRHAARETGAVVTVEDHYPYGGLGEAVTSALAGEKCRILRLAVNGLPRSGKPDELLDRYGISSGKIVEAVRQVASG